MQPRSADRSPRVEERVVSRVTRQWRAYPVAVRIFVCFSLALLVGQYIMLLPPLQSVAESIEPLIGSNVLPFILFLVCMHLLTPAPHRGRAAACWTFLGLALCYAGIDTWIGIGRAESTNPWLRHSPWRPAWMFGVPLFGMLLLLMPGTRKAMSQQDAV